MPGSRFIYSGHALRQMFSRTISAEQVEMVVSGGEVVERYDDDLPYPSALILGYDDLRPIHVVAAKDSANGVTIIITAYEPDFERWLPGFRERRKQ